MSGRSGIRRRRGRAGSTPSSRQRSRRVRAPGLPWCRPSRRARGDWDGTTAILARGRDAIVAEMKASNLRGRGGAGFPTGLKWSFVPKQSEKPKYVLVNGDESEPGTCKDHVLFLHDPHSVIEGTMIAGLAIGSKLGFIYLRGEYRYLLKIVEKAVADAYAKGFLGKNIFGTGVDFD